MLWTGFSLRLSLYFGALSFSSILKSPSQHRWSVAVMFVFLLVSPISIYDHGAQLE